MHIKSSEQLSTLKENTDLKVLDLSDFENIDKALFLNMFDLAGKSIESSKNYLNTINVFPVADGDTGTNMSHTLKGVVVGFKNTKFKDLNQVLNYISRNIVLKSQGNSGSLLASFISEFCNSLLNQTINTTNLAKALTNGYNSAKNTIQEPKKGTILDILEVFSQIFSEQSKTETNILKVWIKALEEAKISLENTINILPEAKKANVIDSGAAGMYIVLDGFRQGMLSQTILTKALDESKTEIDDKLENNFDDLDYTFCVEFIIDCDKESLESLKIKLFDFGDSIQIIPSNGIIKIHIHTNQPDELKIIAKDHGHLANFKSEDMGAMRNNWIKQKHKPLTQTIAEIESELVSSFTKSNDGKMLKLLIITDSSADISKSLTDNNPIWSLNIPVFTDEILSIDLNSSKKINMFYEQMKSDVNFIPKTSQITKVKYEQVFKEALKVAEQVLVLPISSGISKAYEAAIKAKEILNSDRIFILDTQTSSAGLGLVIKHVFNKLEQGLDLDEILNSLIHLRSKLKVYFMVENVKYLERGGRISKGKSKLAQLFNISPLLKLKDGAIQAQKSKVYFSNPTKIVNLLFSNLEKHHKNVNLKDLFIVYAADSGFEKAKLLTEKIEAKLSFNIQPDQILPLSPVIGAHVGPGSIGIIYH